ncbi:hypothetical protein QAD02_022467 [Eretmocerus hayati]|uniref:Uncharacterized protein n=1 Tax=Eretmocerus hayati TaxID=131215 RepID=A0ACC2PU75_9HYME|nr:hypothetical protein QAD02_022467 [Eretmocerus hayati]
MVVEYLHTLATEKFLRPHNLKNSTLIIDGNCICCAMCSHGSYLNHNCFKKFHVKIRSFLQSLRDFKVTPIIVIYGGSQDIKLKTILKRTRDDIKSAEKTVNVTHKSKVRPLLLKEIMKQVAKEMNIKCVQSLIESERDIASIAKILRCPVLSNNSDFFLYGVNVVPFNSFKNTSPECKIYRPDHVSEYFTGLQAKTLPLLEALIGDENAEPRILSKLKIRSEISEEGGKKYQKICDILKWLQNHTLESAISDILNSVDQLKRPKILGTIEKVMNKFMIISPNMLLSLGYSENKVDNLVKDLPIDPYKYKGPLNFSRISDEKNVLDFLDVDDEALTVIPMNEDVLCSLAPGWFIEEFRVGNFPSYFIDMMSRQLYVCAIQLEDFAEPTCVQTSLKIVKVIFALLNAGISNCNVLRMIARGPSDEAKIYEINCNDPVPGVSIPPLKSLRSCQRNMLREIFVKTMGVSKQFLDEFPPEWALYFATIKYWQREADKRFTKDCYLYALLMPLINSIASRQNRVTKPRYYDSKKLVIDEHLKRVTDGDRNVARNVFRGILKGKPPFSLKGIHAFSLFENCLKHSFHLNALLAKPYPEMSITRLYDDSLIYKTYICLKDAIDVTQSVRKMMEASPSLLILFTTILDKLSDSNTV